MASAQQGGRRRTLVERLGLISLKRNVGQHVWKLFIPFAAQISLLNKSEPINDTYFIYLF